MFILEVQVPVIEIGVVVLTALFCGLIFSRLKLSSSIGYILAGMALGPLGFNYLVPNQGIAPFFGEIGILTLMFYLGLELSIKKFKETGAIAFILTIVDMASVFVVGFIIAKVFGFSTLQALVIGSLLPMASTVIIVKFIMERNILQLPESRIAISSLIIEDFIGIVLLIFLSTLSSQKSLNSTVLSGVLFVIAMFFVVRKLSSIILRFVSAERQTTHLALYAVGVGIVVGYIGVLLDLSPILGAYFAGFALAETVYHDKIKKQLTFFREFFIMFFFVNFGAMIIVPKSIDVLVLLAVLLVFYVLTKFFVNGVTGTTLGLSSLSAVTIGALLTPIGEFSLIIAGAAAPMLGDKGSEILGLAFMLMVVTTLAGPFVYNNREKLQQLFLRFYPKNVQRALSKTTSKAISLEKHLAVQPLDPEYYSMIKNLFANLVIAFAVVCLAFLVRKQVSFDFIPHLPSGIAVAIVTLPLILWPMYKFTRELRLLIKKLSTDLWRTKQKAFVQQVSDVIISGLLALLGVGFAVFFWYYSGVDRSFAVLPFLYAFLALAYFSKSLYGLFEKYETLEAVMEEAGAEEHDFVRLSKEFDLRTRHFSELGVERLKTKQIVQEAIASGDLLAARQALSRFKKKESALLSQVNAKTHSVPALLPMKRNRRVIETPAKHHVGHYLVKKALHALKRKKK